MTDTTWQPDLKQYDGPKFRALSAALREDARRGILAPGTRLPAVRELAWQLGVTPGTVARAYQIAAADGVIESHVGRGSYVARAKARLGPLQPLVVSGLPENSDVLIDMRSPQLPDIGQGEDIAAAATRAVAKMGRELLGYPTLTQDRPCRQAMLEWLSCRDLGPCAADDIALTHGGQNALSLALQICLTGDRPRVLVEALAYPGIRHAARLSRGEVVPVEMDEQGMLPDALDRATRQSGARVVCVMPSAQNPTVARMGFDRRAEIVRVARYHDLQMIEDDCFAGPPQRMRVAGPMMKPLPVPALRALAPERGWHVASLSKTISAGLRLGAIVCPVGMGDSGRLAAQHSYFGLSPLVTATVTELLNSGTAERIGNDAQQVIDDRVALAAEILRATDLVWQPGVPFMWLRLPLGWRASTFARAAEAEGVLVRSADEFTPVAQTAPGVPNAVRLAINCGIERARLESGLQALARLYRAPPGDLPV